MLAAMEDPTRPKTNALVTGASVKDMMCLSGPGLFSDNFQAVTEDQDCPSLM